MFANSSLRLSQLLFLTSMCFFCIFRIFVLNEVYSQREVPIEIDDALVYTLAAQKSVGLDLTNSTSGSSSLKELQKIGPAVMDDRFHYARAFSGTKNDHFTFGLLISGIQTLLNLTLLESIITLAYTLQFFQLAAFTLFLRVVIPLDKKETSLALFLLALIGLIHPHIFMGTPFSYSVCLVLLGFTATTKNRVLLGTVLFSLSTLLHLGGLLGIAIIGVSRFAFNCMRIYSSNSPPNPSRLRVFFDIIRAQKTDLIVLALSGLVLTFCEMVTKLYYGHSLFMFNLAFDSVNQQSNVLESIFVNTKGALKQLYHILNFQGMPLALVLLSVFSTLFFNKISFPIALIVAWSLFWLVSFLHIIPFHPGGLTKYTAQYFSLFLIAYISQQSCQFASKLVVPEKTTLRITDAVREKIKKTKLRQKISVSCNLIMVALILFKAPGNTIMFIETRSERGNISDFTHVSSLPEVVLKPNYPLVVSNKVALLISHNFMNDRKVYFTKSYIAGSKIDDDICKRQFFFLGEQSDKFVACEYPIVLKNLFGNSDLMLSISKN